MTEFDSLVDEKAYETISNLDNFCSVYSDEKILRICYLMLDTYEFWYGEDYSLLEDYARYIEATLVESVENFKHRVAYIQSIIESDPELLATMELLR